jgi:hypothetical protein
MRSKFIKFPVEKLDATCWRLKSKPENLHELIGEPLALICRVVYTRHARKQEEECRATFYFPLCCNRIHVMEGRVSVQQS